MSMNDAQRMQQIGGVNIKSTGSTPTQHWKYPDTVGNDTNDDTVNFNSHSTSEYAIRRMGRLSTASNEPFVLFEFMKVDEKFQQTEHKLQNTLSLAIDTAQAKAEYLGSGKALQSVHQMASGDELKTMASSAASTGAQKAKEMLVSLTTPVKRNYSGSIAMYMPTDISINDTMIYNEDTRQFAAGANELLTGGGNAFNNKAVAASKQAVTLGSAALGKGIGKGIVGALVGYGLGDIVSAEMQRSTGALLNPNEFIAYQSTALRSFSFNWTILPDSESESNQAAGLVKLFRSSAHAKRNNPITITVPDHVVTSFHGAKDMIQLPPCVIESVNVTYNPNVSSFFKKNNSPVEIVLAITLKEMVPLYVDDIEAGY